MYMRPETVVSEWSAVEEFLGEHSLGLLTTAIPLAGQATLQASHLPFLFLPPGTPPPVAESVGTTSNNSVDGTWNSGPDDTLDLGRLQCHLARSNPQAKALLSLSAPEEVLVVFSSPLNHAGYISPQWYTTTKPATAKTVPTWNYAELQVYGRILPTDSATLAQITRALSDTHERKYADQTQKAEVWSVDDAPESYVRLLQRAIVGMQIKITKIGLKMKMSRDKGVGDREGVLEGLRGVGGEAGRVADLVERLGPMKRAAS
ncbi:hypothetical protein EX895_000454 [Sporisorium graminicola]|uniref:Transcriptional regulator n=1 Tax=Sporisorium graminicola TaxID=280036 RepID=A0A4U7L165_9BASI|nr:hypothetical protein EX895_000454 [Sporisorium graminicola]TKY90456.1 hypothetical protein EX895_000454 [Sporisorium graminicola]